MELLSLWGLKLGTPEPAPAEQQKACDRAATKSPPPSSSGAENAWYMQPSSCGASLLILRAVRGWYSHYHSHFTDDKTEAQRKVKALAEDLPAGQLWSWGLLPCCSCLGAHTTFIYAFICLRSWGYLFFNLSHSIKFTKCFLIASLYSVFSFMCAWKRPRLGKEGPCQTPVLPQLAWALPGPLATFPGGRASGPPAACPAPDRLCLPRAALAQ